MAKVHRKSREELLKDLEEQLGLLRTSARLFDEGDQPEAKRLAHQLRGLLHKSRESQSLLHLLGIQKTLLFLDTAGHVPPSEHIQSSTPGQKSRQTIRIASLLTPVVPDEKGRWDFKAPLAEHGRDLPPLEFQQWWSNIVVSDGRRRFSRKRLIIEVANKDGGSHVAAVLRASYRALVYENSMGLAQGGSSALEAEPLETPAWKCLRQIAYEVDHTLTSYLAETASGDSVEP